MFESLTQKILETQVFQACVEWDKKAHAKFLEGLEWLRACARCGSIFGKTPLFCGRCKRHLLREMKPSLRYLSLEECLPGVAISPLVQDELSVISALDWTDTNDDLLAPLIYGFKGGGLPNAARQLVAEFIYRIEPRLVKSLKRVDYIVPVPSRSELKGYGLWNDHAGSLALALGEVLNLSVEPGLCRPKTNAKNAKNGPLRFLPQKRKDREQRHATFEPFLLTESFAKKLELLGRPARVLIVDDLVTTGMTVFAAQAAFGGKHDVRVMSLAYRPLAGS